MTVKCLVAISTPGSDTPDNKKFNQIKRVLEKTKDLKRVDTIPGWGNLNQEWYEFTAWVETSFDPIKLECFNEIMNQLFVEAQEDGDILVHLAYETPDGHYTPHTSFPDEDKLITKDKNNE